MNNINKGVPQGTVLTPIPFDSILIICYTDHNKQYKIICRWLLEVKRSLENDFKMECEKTYFLQYRCFQHVPYMVHIEAQSINPTARLARDTNCSVALTWVGFLLTKHFAPTEHDSNCSLTPSDVFTHPATESVDI